ncbi:MAG: hypothetical protein QXK24_06510 [Ignisphaera sp.]
MECRYSLEDITKKLVKLAMEKKLRDTLNSVAPELPDEVRNDIYWKIYRPVMVNFMINLKKVISNE